MNWIKSCRYASIADAISYLILLGYAMPLKYVWGNESAVKILGPIHGGFVILFAFTLYFAMKKANWSYFLAFKIGCTLLVPFLPFFIDKWLKKEQLRVYPETA